MALDTPFASILTFSDPRSVTLFSNGRRLVKLAEEESFSLSQNIRWFLSRKGEALKVEQSGAEPCFIAVGTTVRIRFAPPVSPFSPVPSIAAGAKPGIRRECEPGRDQRIAMCWPRARLALATFHFFIGAEHQRPTGQGFLPRESTPTFPPDDFLGFSRSGSIDCPSISSSSFHLQ